MPRVPVARAVVRKPWAPFGKPRTSWEFSDPNNRPLEEVREIREEIRRRVQKLVAELDAKAA
jgi:protein-tyrosine-phosphatase